jgi:hypothetical protein
MAKRRMLSQNIISDEEYNMLTIEAQWLFQRLLIITDDCGVIPASSYVLKTMCNLPEKIYSKLQEFLLELINVGLIKGFVFEGKRYFCFKNETFEEYQSFIIKNRTKSEYLKIDTEQFTEIYSKLQEFKVNYKKFFEVESYHIESKEHKDKSKKHKVKREGIKLDEIKLNGVDNNGFNENFNNFWDLYDKKVGSKEKIFKKFLKLTNEEIELLLIHVPKYVQSTPEKKYRKNPETYINNKSWNDEIITNYKVPEQRASQSQQVHSGVKM